MGNAERVPGIVRYDLEARRVISARTELGDLMDRWLAYKKGFVKPSTYAGFKLITENHIKPFFLGREIGGITEGDLQDFIVHLYTAGRLDGRGGVGVRTIRDTFTPLKLAMEYAWKYNRAIDKLDWELLEFPKERREDAVRAMTYEEQQRFVKAVYGAPDRRSVSYLLTLFTGLRIGEVCGLQMGDISLQQGSVAVRRTVQRIYLGRDGTRVVVGAPKTEHSERVIPLPEMLLPMLRGYMVPSPGVYFVTGTEKPCEPRTLRQSFVRFLKREGLPEIKYHELRHTFATRAVEIPDFDIKSLSAILGHNNPAFTLAVYGRANREQEVRCMQLMNALL